MGKKKNRIQFSKNLSRLICVLSIGYFYEVFSSLCTLTLLHVQFMCQMNINCDNKSLNKWMNNFTNFFWCTNMLENCILLWSVTIEYVEWILYLLFIFLVFLYAFILSELVCVCVHECGEIYYYMRSTNCVRYKEKNLWNLYFSLYATHHCTIQHIYYYSTTNHFWLFISHIFFHLSIYIFFKIPFFFVSFLCKNKISACDQITLTFSIHAYTSFALFNLW